MLNYFVVYLERTRSKIHYCNRIVQTHPLEWAAKKTDRKFTILWWSVIPEEQTKNAEQFIDNANGN